MNDKYVLMFFLMVARTASHVPLVSAEMVLMEAEAFVDRGGWVIDQQSMDQMGSPYLLAHGLGVPVKDAITMARFDRLDTYRIWVRTGGNISRRGCTPMESIWWTNAG